MLLVVVVERLATHHRLECILRVRKRGDLEIHGVFSLMLLGFRGRKSCREGCPRSEGALRNFELLPPVVNGTKHPARVTIPARSARVGRPLALEANAR